MGRDLGRATSAISASCYFAPCNHFRPCVLTSSFAHAVRFRSVTWTHCFMVVDRVCIDEVQHKVLLPSLRKYRCCLQDVTAMF